LTFAGNKLRLRNFNPIFAAGAGGKLGGKTSAKPSTKRGNRAEVRRERKKRDILSPVNVLSLSNY